MLPSSFSLARLVAIVATGLLALVVVFHLAACGRPTPSVDAGPPIVAQASITLPPGAVFEGTWNGRPGDVFDLSLTIPDPVLDWDIHTHDDGGTQTYIVEFSVSTASYSLRPSHSTTWYLLIKNSGALPEALTGQVEFTSGTSWSGWP